MIKSIKNCLYKIFYQNIFNLIIFFWLFYFQILFHRIMQLWGSVEKFPPKKRPLFSHRVEPFIKSLQVVFPRKIIETSSVKNILVNFWESFENSKAYILQKNKFSVTLFLSVGELKNSNKIISMDYSSIHKHIPYF